MSPKMWRAANIARAVAGDGIAVEYAATGRANLFAARPGVLVLDRDKVNRINCVDEAITLATLPAFKAVVEGEMVATVKLIPFGIESRLRDAAVAIAEEGILRVAPYRLTRVGIVSTLLPGLPLKVIDKALAVTAKRLEPTGASIIGELRVAHDKTALAAAIETMIDLGAEIVIVFGASAIADRRDVIPAAIESLDGQIERFGMPVDPGNLLLIGRARGAVVLGAPGCARSPAEKRVRLDSDAAAREFAGDARGCHGNGCRRIADGNRHAAATRIPVTADNAISTAIVILAAGRSTRAGAPNNLLRRIDSEPIIRTVTKQALASKASRVIVVTGHQAAEIERALEGLDVTCVHNPTFAQGFASSLKTGIEAVPAEDGAAIVVLGDVPFSDAKLIDRLIESGANESGGHIVLPVIEGAPRQSGAVVAAFFQRVDGARRRCRRASPDLPSQRRGDRSSCRGRGGAARCRDVASSGRSALGPDRRIARNMENNADECAPLSGPVNFCAARPAGNARPRDQKVEHGLRRRQQNFIFSSDDKPLPHHRQASDIKCHQPSVFQFGGDGVRGMNAMPSPAITACLMVSLLLISMPIAG